MIYIWIVVDLLGHLRNHLVRLYCQLVFWSPQKNASCCLCIEPLSLSTRNSFDNRLLPLGESVSLNDVMNCRTSPISHSSAKSQWKFERPTHQVYTSLSSRHILCAERVPILNYYPVVDSCVCTRLGGCFCSVFFTTTHDRFHYRPWDEKSR